MWCFPPPPDCPLSSRQNKLMSSSVTTWYPFPGQLLAIILHGGHIRPVLHLNGIDLHLGGAGLEAYEVAGPVVVDLNGGVFRPGKKLTFGVSSCSTTPWLTADWQSARS